MKTYAVVVRATITKTILVDAENKDAAVEIAHGDFTTECDEYDENYVEETLSVEEIES